MKNFLYILNPDEQGKDYDKSLEGFIGNFADEKMNNEFEQWKKHATKLIMETDPFDIFHVTADAFMEFRGIVTSHYSAIGFAVGMAYADLVSERNHESREILDRIKRKLKKSGLLPYLPRQKKERRVP